jgi:hypothetical protein
MVLWFGTVTFAATALAARTFFLGDIRAIVAAIKCSPHRKEQLSPVENSFVSIFVLLYHMMLLGFVLLATYIIQHHPPFPHAERTPFDPDYLLFLLALLGLCALTTIQANESKDRDRQRRNLTSSGHGGGDGSVSESSSAFYHDGSSTISSTLPSIATRRTVRSTGQSTFSGRSGTSAGCASQKSAASSNGSVEEIDLKEGKGSTFLDTLEEESFLLRNRDASTAQSRDESEDMEDVRLEDASAGRSADRRGKAALKPSSAGSSSIDLLNIHQSLEWRGWLSVGFILYRLTDGESYLNDVNLFYNASRVGASCFVFLTGFGHAMYFYSRNNFRPTRVMQVLFRINVVAFFLCATMGTSYILYYACPLHSFAFLITYGVMRANHTINYSKYGLRLKLAVMALVNFATLDFNLGIFALIFSPLFPRGPPSVGIQNGPLWEWYYQSHLHHWISFVGIVYAVNYPISSLLLNKMEALPENQITLAKGTIAASLAVALTFWATGPFVSSKFVYDSTHAYFVFLPVLSFIYFRNFTPYLRGHHLRMLKSIGKYSLEVFLFHHYFFLADDGDSILVLVPGYPKCNVIVASLLLFYVARTVYNLTTILCGMILPIDDENKCNRSMLSFSVCALGFYCIAFAYDSLNMVGTTVIMVTVLIMGVIVYQTIVDLTWTEYKNVGRQLSLDTAREESPIGKATPPVIGGMVILVLGMSWGVLSMAGAAGEKLPLSRSCENHVNNGTWAPVTPCTEFQRGVDSREYLLGGYYRDCEDAAIMYWGWKQTKPNLKCRFRSRSSEEMQKKLSHRKIVFIGDLMVRNLFHALCRLLGDTKAGMYDATVADHADVSKGIGNVRLEYKWAPLAFDQVSKLKDIRTKGNAGQKQPDVVFVGGGAMDRLHVWATDEDQDSQRVAVQKLAKELEFASAPTIWCTPTTVNTPALGNDEKRNQMNEMAISEVRKMYKELEVDSSADFVLDGPSYSRGRASESYDGVLYPLVVYDAGVQIAVNAFDWLLPPSDSEDEFFEPPSPGSLGNPFLGMMIGSFSLIGLFFFDGYFGFSYLSSLFVRRNDTRSKYYDEGSILAAVMPGDLYDEAFVPYHQRLKLPNCNIKGSSRGGGGRRRRSEAEQGGKAMQDSDILSLLDNDSLLGSGRSVVSRRSHSTR